MMKRTKRSMKSTGISQEWTGRQRQEPVAHILQLNNNQYSALAGKKDDEENDTASTEVKNGGKTTGVRHDGETTGVDSDNKSMGVK